MAKGDIYTTEGLATYIRANIAAAQKADPKAATVTLNIDELLQTAAVLEEPTTVLPAAVVPDQNAPFLIGDKVAIAGQFQKGFDDVETVTGISETGAFQIRGTFTDGVYNGDGVDFDPIYLTKVVQ